MKKMKLAVVFAAVVSVFGFSSCLDSGESGPNTRMWWVNVESSYMGTTVLRPDGYHPDISWVPTSSVLTQYGIPEGTKRAVISYTVPEGQDVDSKNIQISLVAGQCSAIPVGNIINPHDSLAEYTSKFKEFQKIYYDFLPAVYTNGRYLMVNCTFPSGNNSPKLALVSNHISESKDTLYLDLKLKAAEGSSQVYSSYYATNYDLYSCQDIHSMVPSNATHDSIYVTVRAMTSEYGSNEKMDSLTTKAKFFY